MRTPLSEKEIEILNKIIPAQPMIEPQFLQKAIRDHISEHKEELMASHGIDENNFREYQSQTAKNIFQFLRDNSFIGEREGGVFFITEKGKNLRKQCTIQQYEAWRTEAREENKKVIHTIETRGYLDQDPIERRGPGIMRILKRFVLYPILVILLAVIAYMAAKHYQLI